MAYKITGVSMVCSTICSGANQRKHQSSASLAFVWGIHRWPVNSPQKGPVTRKLFSFDDVIMIWENKYRNSNTKKQCTYFIIYVTYSPYLHCSSRSASSAPSSISAQTSISSSISAGGRQARLPPVLTKDTWNKCLSSTTASLVLHNIVIAP